MPQSQPVRLIFASPTYGPVDPLALKSQRVALMHAARRGVEFLGDASPDRMKFEVARDAVAQAALETEADGVFWCDSDIILPESAIYRLAQHLKIGLHFVTGIYFQRMYPHWPLIARFSEEKQTFQWIARWPEGVVAPVDGCGFGCLVTSTAMLRQIGREHGRWFAYEKYSEDFDFCRRAAALKYTLYVDTAILCGHLADPRPVTHTDFRAAHPEFFKGEGEEDGTVRSGVA